MKRPSSISSFRVSAEQYGPEYQEHLLAIYKDFVASSLALTRARTTSNAFFLSVNTALISFTGLFAASNAPMTIALAVAGISISTEWNRYIEAARALNQQKFRVICEIEEKLPVATYSTEWKLLTEHGQTTRHRKFTTIEQQVPWIFALLYGVILVGKIIILLGAAQLSSN